MLFLDSPFGLFVVSFHLFVKMMRLKLLVNKEDEECVIKIVNSKGDSHCEREREGKYNFG